MICILDIIEGPARGKRIWVKENQCVEVGRISTADFSVPLDTHMSRRHLLFDSTQSGFRVRDVGSSNGTFLNNLQVLVQELKAGDRIRAGMTTFLVSFKNRDDNPHGDDGISFGQSISRELANDAVKATLESNVKSPGLRTMDFSESRDAESIAELESKASLKQAADETDLASTQLNITLPEWWREYFKPTKTPSLYEQSDTFEAIGGNFLQQLQVFSGSLKLCFVVNESQLNRSACQLIEKLKTKRKLEPLSKTLYFSKQVELDAFWEVVEVCLGQDAIVCFGNRIQLNGKDLASIINSLSFPSMFYQDLVDPSGVTRKLILDRVSFAMFESSRDGKVYLLMRS